RSWPGRPCRWPAPRRCRRPQTEGPPAPGPRSRTSSLFPPQRWGEKGFVLPPLDVTGAARVLENGPPRRETHSPVYPLPSGNTRERPGGLRTGHSRRRIVPVSPRPNVSRKRSAMQLGLFSVSYAGLWGQATLDVRQFIRHAAELGFDAAMLAGNRPHLSPLDADEDTLAALRQELQAAGVRCAVVAAYTDLGAAVAAEVPLLEMQIAYVESLCRIGARLGANIVRVFTAYEAGGQSPHALWQRVV